MAVSTTNISIRSTAFNIFVRQPLREGRKDYKLTMKRGLKIGLLEDVVAAHAMGEPLPERREFL